MSSHTGTVNKYKFSLFLSNLCIAILYRIIVAGNSFTYYSLTSLGFGRLLLQGQYLCYGLVHSITEAILLQIRLLVAPIWTILGACANQVISYMAMYST